MTSDEQDRMQLLCERIAVEQDQEKFVRLVRELNQLLDHKTQRLDLSKERQPPAASTHGVCQSTE
jgi:hypothetical protein